MSKIYGIGDEEELAEDLQKELFELKRNPNIIEIPDNATNGEVIKALFPNALIYVNTTLKQVFLCTYDDKFDEDFDRHITFPLDWWNAPYKKGENNGNS